MGTVTGHNRIERAAGAAYFLLCIAWIVINLTLVLSYKPDEFDHPVTKLGHLDFVRFYAMGPVVVSSQRDKIYEPAVQLEATNRVLKRNKWDRAFYMEHPPYVFFLAAPLAFLPIVPAFYAFNLFSFAIGCAAILYIARDKPFLYRLALIVGVNATWIAWDNYSLGQLGMILFGIEALYFISLLRKNDKLSGLALALMTIKPQYLPFLLIPLAVMKRWKALLYAAAAEAALLIASMCWFGWRNVIFYPSIVAHFYWLTNVQRNKAAIGFINSKFQALKSCLIGPLTLTGNPHLAQAVALTFFLGSLVAVAVIWQKSANDERRVRWAVALTVLASLLFSMHVYLYDCCAAILAVALTLPSLNPLRAFTASPMSLRIWSVCLIGFPVIGYTLTFWIASGAPPFEVICQRAVVYTVFQAILFAAGTVYFCKHVLRENASA